MADQEQLVAALAQTLSPDAAVRGNAEKVLANAGDQPGFLGGLLQVAVNEAVDSSVRLAAVVQLKNIVRFNWSVNEEDVKARKERMRGREQRYAGSTKHFVIPESDKSIVRGNLVEAVARAETKALRRTLAGTVQHVCSIDYPAKWPDVVGNALALIVTQDPSRMHAGVVILDKLSSSLMHKSKVEERGALNEMVGATFPLLTELLQALVQQNVNELYAAELIKCTCKIFFKVFYLGVPPTLLEEAKARQWAELFSAVVRKQLPLEMVPSDLDARHMHPWWKAKRRAAQALAHMLTRYGVASHIHPSYRGFSEIVSKPHGIGQDIILPTALWLLRGAYLDNVPTTPTLTCLMLRVFDEAVEFSVLFQMMKPELSWLVRDVLIPSQRWKREELEEWQADPEEFVQNFFVDKDMVFISERGPDLASDAGASLEMLCRMRRRYALAPTMELAGQICSAFKMQPNDLELALQKSAALRVFESLAGLLRRDESFNLEQLIAEHILPDIASPFPFLRLTACRTLAKFFKAKWSGPAPQVAIAQAIIELCGDRELPVRVEAASCIGLMVTTGGKPMHQVVLQVIAEVVKRLLAVTQQVSVDSVFDSLRLVIAHFPSEVIPFAPDLCRNIGEAFYRIVTDMSIQEDDIQASAAAADCLNSLDTLLSALALDANNPDGNPQGRQMLLLVVPTVTPLLDVVIGIAGNADNARETPLDEMADDCAKALFAGAGPPSTQLDMLDYLDTALHIMHNIVYHTRSVPEGMWRYVPILARVAVDFGDSDSQKKVMNNFESMVHFVPQGLMAPGPNRISYLQIMLDVISRATNEYIHEVEEADKAEGGDEDDDDDEDYEDDDDVEEDEDEDYTPDAHKAHHDGEGDVNVHNSFSEMFGGGDDGDESVSYASFLLCTILQSCPGQLDAYIESILETAVRALKAPITDSEVMVELLNVVESAVYYNAELTLRYLGANHASWFLEIMFDYLDEHKMVCEKMIAFLSLTRILSLAPSLLSDAVNKLRPRMVISLAQLAAGLDNLRTVIAQAKAEEAAKREQDAAAGKRVSIRTEEDDYNYAEDVKELKNPGAEDVPEDQNVFDVKDSAVFDMAELPEGDRMRAMAGFLAEQQGLDDEEGDDDEDEDDGTDAVSPVDDVDEFVFLFTSLAQAPPQARAEFEQLMQRFSSENPDVAGVLQKMVAEGQRRATARGQ